MVAFSSRGPTNDGRIKPEVVAPGTFVLSTRSRATMSKGWALSGDPLYSSKAHEHGDTARGRLHGEHPRLPADRARVENPSAALLKALVINGAVDMTGQYAVGSGAIPNNSEGFGRVDLQAVVGPYGPGETLIFFDENKKLDTGQAESRVVQVPPGVHLLKATLVWTDPPGEGLQSDLDLIVTAGTQTRHGNVAAGSTAFDRVNNVEQVVWSRSARRGDHHRQRPQGDARRAGLRARDPRRLSDLQ
jgi:hypothetical protein